MFWAQVPNEATKHDSAARKEREPGERKEGAISGPDKMAKARGRIHYFQSERLVHSQAAASRDPLSQTHAMCACQVGALKEGTTLTRLSNSKRRRSLVSSSLTGRLKAYCKVLPLHV